MENLNIKKKGPSSSLWGGLIIILVGIVFLIDSLNFALPYWVFRWHTLVLGVGLILGMRHNFKGGGWMIMVLVGGLFTLKSVLNVDYNFSRILWPAILIAVGAYMIFKPKRGRKNMFRDNNGLEGSAPTVDPGATSFQDEFIDSVNVFGGSHQKVFSKNFKGGDILAVFGGCDVDLSQADFQDVITLEVTAIFGGCKIIIPPTWEVKSEITAIFGGVDEKRNLMPGTQPSKRLILKGLALFGGVDIRNY